MVVDQGEHFFVDACAIIALLNKPACPLEVVSIQRVKVDVLKNVDFKPINVNAASQVVIC